MSISIRPATKEEVVASVDLFVETLYDLRRRFSLVGQPIDKVEWTRGFHHILDTGIFYVAVVDQEIVGVCNGVVRDNLWFLTSFWVDPKCQGQGIGKKLIDKVWETATDSGADNFFVWSSIDMRAMHQYLRLGMLPGYQIFTYKISLTDLPTGIDDIRAELHDRGILHQGHRTGYRVEPLTISVAAAIDLNVRGAGREIDHEYLMIPPSTQAFALIHDEKPVGYFYLQAAAVGPAAWLSNEHGSAVLSMAIAMKRPHSDSLVFLVPGCNHLALKAVIAMNGRMVSTSHFFTANPFGKLECYLPSGPLLY
ncbi:MAG: GNAT family N-acetyltransferase [Candidatus Obscuribacterales bacterium]|nr:GNAT family N-acetyltransferase [Candidatus Obscuribacterales bacterium]